MRSKHRKIDQIPDCFTTKKVKLKPEEYAMLDQIQLPFPLEPGDFEIDFEGDPMTILASTEDFLGEKE